MLFTKLHFQEHKTYYEILALSLYFFINAAINATSDIMEAQRGNFIDFAIWEPFVWEFSSALSSLLLLPCIAIFMTKYSWQWQQPKLSIVIYLTAAMVFAACHVSIMVLLREISYLFTAREYDFANSAYQLAYELLYEFRKDIWSFFFFVIAITAYRHILTLWLGDANCIDDIQVPEQGEVFDNAASPKLTKYLLVKKLGKEFLIKTEQVEWIQAAGNYVNLHIGDKLYPTRMTLADFVEGDETRSLCRIHKSFAVNLNFIHCITPLASGDAEVTLQSGKTLRLSRRYKEPFNDMKTATVYQ
jgi:hypothetical protein